MKTFSIPPFYLYLLVKKTFLCNNYLTNYLSNQPTNQPTNYNQKNINEKRQNLKFYL